MNGTDQGTAGQGVDSGWIQPARRWFAELLTPREWMVLFKLLAIAVLLFVLIYTKIAVEFPAEQFIYGRF
jgi:hypothetical protein